MDTTTYYHTELRGSHASKQLRRGQVRTIGGRSYILLRRSRHIGEWVVGHYSDGVTCPAETWPAADLRRFPVVGRVGLSIRS